MSIKDCDTVAFSTSNPDEMASFVIHSYVFGLVSD